MNEIETGAANAQASTQADQNSSTAQISSGSGEDQPGRIHDGHELPTLAGATKSSGRRGLAAALLGATAAIALLPKKAAADLSFGDVQGAVRNALRAVVRPLLEAIQNILGDIFDFLREVLRFIGFGIPGIIFDVLNWIIDELFGTAGEDSYTGSVEQISNAMERSYWTPPPATSDDRRLLAEMQAEGIRARVQESLQACTGIARQQADITDHEAALVAESAAAQSIPALLAANNALMASLSGRVGMLIATQAAQATLLADQTMQRSADLNWAWKMHDLFIGEGRAAQPPSEVGPLPGVPE
jgi:hypothetical protein